MEQMIKMDELTYDQYESGKQLLSAFEGFIEVDRMLVELEVVKGTRARVSWMWFICKGKFDKDAVRNEVASIFGASPEIKCLATQCIERTHATHAYMEFESSVPICKALNVLVNKSKCFILRSSGTGYISQIIDEVNKFNGSITASHQPIQQIIKKCENCGTMVKKCKAAVNKYKERERYMNLAFSNNNDSGKVDDLKSEIRIRDKIIDDLNGEFDKRLAEALERHVSTFKANYEGMFTLVEWNAAQEQTRQISEDRDKWERRYHSRKATSDEAVMKMIALEEKVEELTEEIIQLKTANN